MKKNQLFYGILILIGGFIFACSGESAEESDKAKLEEVVALPGEDTTSREPDDFSKLPFKYNEAKYRKIKKIVDKYKNVSHFTLTKSGFLFIQATEDYVNAKNESKVRFALLDETGTKLLPLECQQISNPGFILKDNVEYKMNGKYGLFNYETRKKIDAKYDIIYPSRIMEYIAFGERQGKLYKIYEDGHEKALGEEENSPNYYNLINDFKFNYSSKHFAWWYSSSYFDDAENFDYPNNYGMIMPPSYLSKLSIVKPIMSEIFIGGDSLDYQAVKLTKRSEDLSLLSSKIYRYFGESRGYSENTYYLTSISKNNQIKSSVELYTDDSYIHQDMPSGSQQKVLFLNDSLIEVKNFYFNNDDDEYNTFLPYQRFTKYEYYSIAKNGKITKLGNGNYPMISAIQLSRTHFKGVFNRILTEFEMIEKGYDPEAVYSNVYLITDHLSAADLEFMINELYAYKGMKFSDTALSNYFSQFSWYKPRFKNVDNKLTDIEKRNISTIKNLIRDLNKNPGKYIHEETVVANMAG